MRVLLIGVDGRVYSMAKNMAEHGHTLAVVGGRDFMAPLFHHIVDAEPDNEEAVMTIANLFKPDLIVPVSWETSHAGIVDRLRAEGFSVFGASLDGIALEASKYTGLRFSEMLKVPVAPYKMAYTVAEIAHAIKEKDYLVVKRTGFAGGKGVTIWDNDIDAYEQALKVLDLDGEVMIQKKIDGVPVNLVWMQTPNGQVPICMQTDYKRTYSGDLGPFCGAMGATIWNHIPDKVVDTMIKPFDEALAEIGYFGRVGLDCMYETATGKLYVIEWTARFGTPTTETLFGTWDDDIACLLKSWLAGELKEPEVLGKIGIGVAIAGGGYPYPDMVLQGLPVKVDGQLDDVIPIGVSGSRMMLRTKGGRHFVAVGHGNTIEEAQKSAYGAVKKVSFTDMFYRIDIGEDMKLGNVFTDIEERWSDD